MKNTQASEAFEILKKKIISYELEPNQSISVNGLAQELNMSRTPVKEAVQLLESYGLVTNGEVGLRVAGLELRDIIEICQVREALETQAVKIIIENGGLTQDQIEELRKIVSKHGDAADSADYGKLFSTGSAFHQKIIEYSGNRRLMDALERIELQNARAQWLNIFLPDRRSKSYQEHSELIDALEREDLDAAFQCVQEHATDTLRSYYTIMEQPALRSAVMEISNLLKG